MAAYYRARMKRRCQVEQDALRFGIIIIIIIVIIFVYQQLSYATEQ